MWKSAREDENHLIDGAESSAREPNMGNRDRVESSGQDAQMGGIPRSLAEELHYRARPRAQTDFLARLGLITNDPPQTRALEVRNFAHTM